MRRIQVPNGPALAEPLTRQEAHDIVARLFDSLDNPIKSMPSVSKTAAEQQAHEARLNQQIADFHKTAYTAERRRSPLRERLQEIFNTTEEIP